MREDYYLQPFNNYLDKKGNVKFRNVNILDILDNNFFEIKKTLNIFEKSENYHLRSIFSKHPNLINRLKKINNPLIHKNFFLTKNQL